MITSILILFSLITSANPVFGNGETDIVDLDLSDDLVKPVMNNHGIFDLNNLCKAELIINPETPNKRMIIVQNDEGDYYNYLIDNHNKVIGGYLLEQEEITSSLKRFTIMSSTGVVLFKVDRNTQGSYFLNFQDTGLCEEIVTDSTCECFKKAVEDCADD